MRLHRFLAITLFVTACGGGAASTTTRTAAATPPSTPAVPPSTMARPDATPSTTIPTPMFRVVLVESDDVLNVRADPNASSDIVATLPFDSTGIELTGQEQPTDGGVWKEVVDPPGWVNGFYLSGDGASEEQIETAVADFAAALESGGDLRPAVDDRGLFVISFDTPKRFAGLDLAVVLRDETVYSWGAPHCSPGECTTEATFSDAVAADFLDAYRDDDVVISFNQPVVVPGGSAPESAIPELLANFAYAAIHDPGDDPEADGIDWTTWYAFVDGSTKRVVALVVDRWAP